MLEATISVQIAAYKDKDLQNTISDCLEKATNKKRIYFSVCRQGDDNTPLIPKNKIRLLDYASSESLGAGWARAECLRNAKETEYTLIIDAHMRFAEGWDVSLIEKHSSFEGAVLLSKHPAGFVGDKLNSHKYVPKVTDYSLAVPLIKATHWEEGKESVVTNLTSMAFVFGLSSVVRAVGIDPRIYFYGEEIAFSVRAYTRGIDIIAVPEHYVYHDYAHHTKHSLVWVDHPAAYKQQDKISRQVVGTLLELQGYNADLEEYGKGSVRSLQAYEKFLNVSFQKKQTQVTASLKEYKIEVYYKLETVKDLKWVEIHLENGVVSKLDSTSDDFHRLQSENFHTVVYKSNAEPKAVKVKAIYVGSIKVLTSDFLWN